MVEASPQRNKKLLQKAGELFLALQLMAEEEIKENAKQEPKPKFAPSTQALRRAVVQVYKSPAENDRQL